MPLDAVEALNIFLTSLKDFAKLHDRSNIRFILKDGCIEAGIEYPETDVDIDKEIEDLLNGSSEDNLKIRLFKSIQDKVKQNGLDYSVTHKVKNINKNVTEVFKSKNFSYKRGPRKEWEEELVFIDGEIFDAGGKKNANIHVSFGNEELKIECTKEQANQVHPYNKFYFSAVKKWKEDVKPQYMLVENYLTEDRFKKYRTFYNSIIEDNTLSKYDFVYNEIIRVINDDGINNGELLKIMRLFNFDFCDRGIIRTILMAIKPKKAESKKISEMYKALADTLRKNSTNNVI
jgi:hypothetical protein